MFKKILMAFILGNVFLYVAGCVMAEATKSGCKGFDCEEVYCPDKYAVRLPDGSYLPCEQFDLYVRGYAGVAIPPNPSPDYDKLIAEEVQNDQDHARK